MGENKNGHRIVVGKPERNTQLGRHRNRWEVNIETRIGEVECEGVEWIENLSA
jgi:hypothetical protein